MTVPFTRSPETQLIHDELVMHSHRCPSCKSSSLTSNNEHHRCLSCGRTVNYGEEYPSIAQEDPNHSCGLCRKV